MKHARRTAFFTVALLASSWLCGFNVVLAQNPNPNSKLCFRNVIGLPGPFFQRPPKIDGCLHACDYTAENDTPAHHDDFGWQSAFQFVANPINSVDPPAGDMVAQGIYDPAGSGSLDLSFDVKNDPVLDEQDAVVIAMEGAGPDGNGNYSLLVIFPFLNHAGSAYNGPIGVPVNQVTVGQIQYIPGTLNTSDPNNLKIDWDLNNIKDGSSWVAASVNSGGSGSNWAWTVEVQIRRSQIEGPPGIQLDPNKFNFFFDVIRAYPIVDPNDPNNISWAAFDMPWPPAATIGTVASTPPTPFLAQWGSATINSGVCGGVSFQPSDIKTNQSDPTMINTNPAKPNRFSVTLQNTLIDTRPGPNQNKPVAAKAITTHFRIANFGLPSNLAWAPIPNGNDVSNTADVPAAANNIPGTVTLTTPAPGWVPDPAWTSANLGHQCIWAELSSPSSDVVFVNKSAYQNMNYGFNPGFEPVAFVDGRWGQPPGGKSFHTFDILKLPTYQYAYSDGTVEGIPTGKLTAQVTLIFVGYRHTGRFVTLRKAKVEIVTPVGYYGYLVQHELADDFAKPFAVRHDRQIKAAFDFDGTLEQKWGRVNKALQNDPEKPTGNDWNLSFPDLKPVAGFEGLLRLDVDKDKVSQVKGTIRYTGGVTGGGGGCCPGRTGASTTPKVGMLGLVVLVGAVLGRRRRRR